MKWNPPSQIYMEMVGFALPLKGYTHPTSHVIARLAPHDVGARHAVPLPNEAILGRKGGTLDCFVIQMC